MLELRPTPFDHPDSLRLIAEIQQVDASAGYAPMAAFGTYADSPSSRYFAKLLAVAAPQ